MQKVNAETGGPGQPCECSRASSTSREERALLLSRVQLLSSLDADSLGQVAEYVEAIHAPAGAIVVRQGDAGDCIYIASKGTFGVFVTYRENDDETRVATIGPGECFGEMALLSDQPRSATIRAEEDGELLRLEQARFRDLLSHHPGVGHCIISTLSQRLRTADTAIARLTDAVELMEEDRLTREHAAGLAKTEGDDEVSRLSKAFGRMAQQVIAREEQLRQQVAQLRIEIDEAKRAREVAQITESEYFQQIQKRSREMREKRAH